MSTTEQDDVIIDSNDYAGEKLSLAVYELAVGAGDVRERLLSVDYHFLMLTEDDFPSHLIADWNSIVAQMKKFGPVYKPNGDVMVAAVAHTMRRIKRATGVKIAKRIIKLHDDMEYWLEDQ